MLNSFLSFLGRKKETPQEAEERKRKEIMDAMNRHMEDGDEIREGLGAVRLEDLETSLAGMLKLLDPAAEHEGIPEDKLKLYRSSIAELQKELENGAITDLNTTAIDSGIKELIIYFGNAVARGKEGTADRLLLSLADAIQYSRTPFLETTPEKKAAELVRRNEQMIAIVAMAELQDVADQIAESIENVKLSIDRKETEVRSTKEDLKEYEASREDGKEILSVYRKTGKITDKDFVTQWSKYANRVINAKNDREKLSVILAHKELNQDKIMHIREMMKISDFMKEQPVTDQILQRFDQILEMSKSAVAKENAQRNLVDEMERKAEAIFDVMEENMVPELDRILREYEKIEREDRKNEKALQEEKEKLARQELKEKEKEKETDTVPEKTVLMES